MGQARELMDRSTRAVLDGDLDALREVYAADVVVTTPDSGTLHGIEQLLEWNRSFVDAFSDRDYSSQRSLETQDCAIDQGDFRGTHTRPLQLPDGQQVPPTGRQVTVRSADIATVSGGRIVRHDFYFDQMDMMAQLGLLEEAATAEQ